MGKFLDKFYNLMGLGDEMEEIEQPERRPETNEREEREFSPSRRIVERSERAAVVSLAAERQKKELKVVVIEPKSFDEAKTIADHLKNRYQVILNLEKADREMAQRIIDFVSGTTYALNGSMQKVGTQIFVFAPSNVDISGEVLGEDTYIRTPLSWAK
ncbi:MAG: cell division protein SepF [Heliobacteriaceae bacterium]|nr:cell division protein SepF [Heliobacteriaceae bacterium]MDD4587473.1 cell division protein SepF [Heliobacteriaceae bacterium]